LIRTQRGILKRLSDRLSSPVESVEERLEHLVDERDRLMKEIAAWKVRMAEAAYRALEVVEISGVSVLRGVLPDTSMETLRGLTDRFREEYDSGIVVLASIEGDRPIIVAALTKDLVERGLSANELIKVVAEVVGGSGGGRPTLAQAGGSEAGKLPEALEGVDEWVRSHLN
jgi:alanyl-tRNA synthetase